MGPISPASGDQWVITAGDQRAVVVEVGGGLREYAVGDWQVLDGYSEQEMAPGAAGQVLAPWPNRIRDGRYAFGGHEYTLPLTEPEHHNAMHGLVRWQPWQLRDQAADRVHLTCLLPAQTGYPWSLRLDTIWSLGSDGLRADHEVVNLSDRDCPFGLGVHPYLRLPGVTVDETTLTARARTRLVVDDQLIPTGETDIAGTEYDFTEPWAIGALELDTAYGGVDPADNAVRLASAKGRETVRVWADAAFGWWQVFTGDTLPGERRRRSIAVEPMTCPPDAFRTGTALITLEPGATWRSSWGVAPSTTIGG